METEPRQADRWSWLTEDYTPWANKYVYWLKTPLGVLVTLSFVSLLMGVFVTPQGYVLLVTILTLTTVGIAWPGVGLRGIECKLTFQTRRCREGDTAKIVVEVANRWPFPVWGLSLENGFFSDVEQDNTSAVALAQVPGWSRNKFVWEFVPEERGVYPQKPPLLCTEFPFGIWKARRSVDVSDSLIVWPKTFRLSNFPLPEGKCQTLATPSNSRTGNEGEKMGVREYRKGDSLRSVHWALTARHGRFIVSERQGSAQSEARVILDTNPDSHVGSGPQSSFAWSLRIAASIALELAEQHTIVNLHFGRNHETITNTRQSITRAMDSLARFQVSRSQPTTIPGGQHRPWSLVVCTDRSPVSWPTSRRVALQTSAFSDGDDSRPILRESEAPTWIEVDSDQRIESQVVSQWSKKSREAWCGG